MKLSVGTGTFLGHVTDNILFIHILGDLFICFQDTSFKTSTWLKVNTCLRQDFLPPSVLLCGFSGLKYRSIVFGRSVVTLNVFSALDDPLKCH